MITTIPPSLPEGKRYAVCMTFDFDTFSFRIGRMKHYSPTLVSRGNSGISVHRGSWIFSQDMG